MKYKILPLKPKEKENIFFQGNVVVSTNGSIVMITAGMSFDNHSFCGVVLSDNSLHKQGEYDNRWSKSCFEQFYGTFLLINEP